MSYYLISAAVNAIIAIGLAVFIVIESPLKQMHRAFIYFALAVFAWSAAYGVWQLTDNQDSALFWSRALMAGAIYTAIAYFHFVAAFLGIYKQQKYLIWLGYVVMTVFELLNFTPYFVSHVEPYLGFKFWPMPGIAFHPYLIIWFGYLVYATILLIRHYLKSGGHLRGQIQYLLLGIFIAFLGGATNYFPWYKIPIPPYGNILVAVYLAIFAYAITVYHLMNITVVLRLGAIFSTLLTVIAGFYFAATSLLSGFLGEPYNILLPAFIIVLSYAPLKRFVENLTDRFLFQKHYKLSEVLDFFAQTIHQAGPDLSLIVKTFNETIIKVLKVKKTAFALIPSAKDFMILQQAVRTAGIEIIYINNDSSLIKYFDSHPGAIIDCEDFQKRIGRGSYLLPVEKAALCGLEKFDFNIAIPVEFKGRIKMLYLVGPKKSKDVFYRDDLQFLEHTVHEAAAFIDNISLYEDLKSASEAKSHFIGVVSHQLRTPISGMRWSIETLKQPGLSQKDRQSFLDHIYDKTVFLSEQIDNILTALEIYDKKMFLQKTDLRVGDIYNELIVRFMPIIKEKALTVESEIEKTANLVKCDSEKIKKVIRTLFENAISYSRTGGKIVLRVLKETTNDQKRLVVSVEDDGIGLSKADEQHLFEEFFRSEEGKLLSPNGLGLSLFISRAIIEAHGGTLRLTSRGKNRGATAYFDLPLN